MSARVPTRVAVWTAAVALGVCLTPANAQLRPPAAGKLPGAITRPGGVPRSPELRGKITVDRLRKLTPSQRKRALQNIPPERRLEIEKRLRQYDSLSPEERRRLSRTYESFQNLPKRDQEAMRRLYRRFNQVPEERRGVLREELNDLQALDEEDRRSRVNSDEFRNKYNLSEKQFLEDLSRILADARRSESAPEQPEAAQSK